MGFLSNAVCYATYDEAMSAKFGADPVLVTVANTVDKLHFFEAINGVWYWSEYQTTGGAWTLAYHSTMPTIGFPVCDLAASAFDPVLAGSLWMFALSIILGCWVLAKNAGLILEAIRRW